MARAKRTDRAEARRRYRATQSEDLEQDLADDDVAPSATSTTATGKPAPKPTSAKPKSATGSQPTLPPGARPSFTASFRAAARPIDIRSDIAYLPTLILHTRAVWVPALAAIASGAYFLISQPLGSNGIANLVFQLFVLPPTIAGAFLAGILAPRATYMAGGIAALVGALVFAFAVAITPTSLATAAVGTPSPSAVPSASAAVSPDPSASAAPSIEPSPSPAASPAPAGTIPMTDSDKISAILQSILLSVPFGVAIGGFGGYYRRFLYISNPSRQRKAMEQQRQKAKQPAPKRRF